MTTTLPKKYYKPIMTIEVLLCMLVCKAPFTVHFQDGNYAAIHCFAVCVNVTGVGQVITVSVNLNWKKSPQGSVLPQM